MLKLHNTFTCPPGGFVYTHPKTGQGFKEIAFNDLVSRIHQHERANILPYTTREELEDSVCRSLGPEQCRSEDPVGHRAKNTIPFEAVMQGTRTLVDWFLHGRQMVDQNEANRRSTVCASCTENQPIETSGCTACSFSTLSDMVTGVIGNRTTTQNHMLKSCTVCKCNLKVKVWTPLETILKHTPERQLNNFPPHCWVVAKQ